MRSTIARNGHQPSTSSKLQQTVFSATDTSWSMMCLQKILPLNTWKNGRKQIESFRIISTTKNDDGYLNVETEQNTPPVSPIHVKVFSCGEKWYHGSGISSHCPNLNSEGYLDFRPPKESKTSIKSAEGILGGRLCSCDDFCREATWNIPLTKDWIISVESKLVESNLMKSWFIKRTEILIGAALNLQYPI